MLYKYKCDICNNVYVGKTKRHLIVPQYEHLGKEISTDKFLRYSDKDATAIRKQCHSLDHLASIDKFSILGNAMNNYHLSLKESLLILIIIIIIIIITIIKIVIAIIIIIIIMKQFLEYYYN